MWTGGEANTGVKITSEGRPYLGVPIGTDDFVESFVSTKVQEWVAQLEKLALIACSQQWRSQDLLSSGAQNGRACANAKIFKITPISGQNFRILRLHETLQYDQSRCRQ